MKKLPVHLLIVMLVVAMAWITGCSSDDSPLAGADDLMTRSENPNFNDEFGGYNMQGDEPGFGDPELLAEYNEDEAYNDPIESDPAVVDLERTQHDQLFLMVTWGNVHRDSTIEHETEWSGSLSIDPGVLMLKRTIRFEPRDQILPRTQRDLIEWNSYTGPGFDGILVRIIATPPATAADSTVDSSMTYIRFDTAPLSVEFTLDELPGLHRVITLADGNAVAFNAVRIDPNACPHGFMVGAWRNNPERRGGEFFGKWETQSGEIKGFLKGIYGVNNEGERVFFGKMITRDGDFHGIMRGRWEPKPDDENGGWFAGHWVSRDRRIHGGLKGEWKRSERCHGGFFRGMWAVNCER